MARPSRATFALSEAVNSEASPFRNVFKAAESGRAPLQVDVSRMVPEDENVPIGQGRNAGEPAADADGTDHVLGRTGERVVVAIDPEQLPLTDVAGQTSAMCSGSE